MQEKFQQADSTVQQPPKLVISGDTSLVKPTQTDTTLVKITSPIQPLVSNQVSTDTAVKKTVTDTEAMVVKNLPVLVDTKEAVAVTAAPLASNTQFFERKDSFFWQHSLQIKNEEAIVRTKTNPDWLIFFIFLSLAMFTYIKALYSKRIKQTFHAAVESQAFSQLMREESVLFHRDSMLMLLMFLVNFSVFVYQSHNYYESSLFGGAGIFLFLKIFLFVSGFYLLKFLIVNFLSFLFKAEDAFSEYIFNLLLFNKISGLILLPMIICNAYLSIVPPKFIFLTGFIIIIILFIKRLFRGIIDGISKTSVSKTYLFLYLCTLEILPILVLTKIILDKT